MIRQNVGSEWTRPRKQPKKEEARDTKLHSRSVTSSKMQKRNSIFVIGNKEMKKFKGKEFSFVERKLYNAERSC